MPKVSGAVLLLDAERRAKPPGGDTGSGFVVRRLMLVFFLAAGLTLCIANTASAAEIGISRLIWALEIPEPPAEPPRDLLTHFKSDEQGWTTKRDEVWSELRLEAQKELARTGAPAVLPLLDLIARSKDNSVKIAALTTLSSMENPADLLPAGPSVVKLLEDGNVAVRYLAAKTIGVIRYGAAARQLAKFAEDKEEVMRLVVADALGRIGHPDGLEPLLALMSDTKKDVSLRAIKAIGELGIALAPRPKEKETLDVVAILIEKLRSDDISERDVAVRAIDELLGYDITADSRWLLVRKDGEDKKEKRELIIKEFEAWWSQTLKTGRSDTGEPELALRLSMCADLGQKKPVRLKAIARVQEIGTRKAVDYLILVMPDADKDIRQAATAVASALSGIKIQFLPADTETKWIDKVDEFRLRWKERKDEPIRAGKF